MTSPWRDFDKFRAEREQAADLHFAQKAWSKFATEIWGEGSGKRGGESFDEFWYDLNEAGLSQVFTFCSSEVKIDTSDLLLRTEKSEVWSIYMKFLSPERRGKLSLCDPVAMFCRLGSGLGVVHNHIIMSQAPFSLRVCRRGRDPGTGIVVSTLTDFARDAEVDRCMIR